MIALDCHTGIGNRVAALANAMSRDDEVVFHWRTNRHCPAGHDEIFHREIAGVTFVDDPTPRMFTSWDQRLAHDWAAAGDRAKADAAYATIMAAMVGEAIPNPPETAILGRFHRNPDACPINLADRAADAVLIHARSPRQVFLLSDLYRYVIATRLADMGIEVIFPTCPPLPDDLSRTSADLHAYLADWKTLLSARRIIACNGPASALHPARAAGIPIDY